MIHFLANTLEQMDLALDQLCIEDPNYKRFALMLVDNVVELCLHNHAKEVSIKNERWVRLGKPKYNERIVNAAKGQKFGSKTRLAVHTGLMNEKLRQSIALLHEFRNQVYHRGLSHESILPAISLFYFQCACDLLKEYKPGPVSWTMGQKLPFRAKKYLGTNLFECASGENYTKACIRLKDIAEEIPIDIAGILSTDAETTINRIDELIDFLAEDGQEKMSRDAAIIFNQAWHATFTEEGREFIRENSFQAGSIDEYVAWIGENYPCILKKDPVPSWRRRLSRMQNEKDTHKALQLYCSFMKETEDFRTIISDAARALDSFIQQQIDVLRGK